MVGLGGFEPPTSPLSGVRSNQLSYNPIFINFFRYLINVREYFSFNTIYLMNSL